jgi:hypothetical protein
VNVNDKVAATVIIPSEELNGNGKEEDAQGSLLQ